jgi:effector-binding domain-containing protein
LLEKFNIGVKQVPEFHVAAVRLRVPSLPRAQKLLNQAYDELFNYLHRLNVQTQYCTGMICRGASTDIDDVDIEAVLLVRSPLENTDRVSFYKVPESLVASGVHVGDFSGIADVHIALHEWIAASGYEICGAYREFYLKHDLRNLKDTITEVQYPVRKK